MKATNPSPTVLVRVRESTVALLMARRLREDETLDAVIARLASSALSDLKPIVPTTQKVPQRAEVRCQPIAAKEPHVSEKATPMRYLPATTVTQTKPGLALAEPKTVVKSRALTSHGVSYELLGQTYTASSAMEATVDILRTLARSDPNFYSRLSVAVKARTRNHIARARLDVYPKRPDLADYITEIAPGWFIGNNVANREKEKFLREACKVRRLVFGRDLKINLPNA